MGDAGQTQLLKTLGEATAEWKQAKQDEETWFMRHAVPTPEVHMNDRGDGALRFKHPLMPAHLRDRRDATAYRLLMAWLTTPRDNPVSREVERVFPEAAAFAKMIRDYEATGCAAVTRVRRV